ncbi:P-loop containing nucleoside triphosphate hydrolase protein [Bisporella sp. PMI_857]|nr:P-loop containing nucleoside triphosphate hydrolase protein [Bisporella sp. PMI_857]
MSPSVTSPPTLASLLPPDLENLIVTLQESSTSKLHVPISTSSLDSLQSGEQRRVLNIVDSLRQCGLEGIVSLPQLVVCGDQSSGKSSVLEAIAEIPFPRRENLCTRFATEIVLRRASVPSIKTRIIPEKTRPKQEQAELERFKESISDFRELSDLIDGAAKLMGIAETTDQTRKAFARDVLSIEISGPDRPQLTLVDLPGLVHSENKNQSSDDVQLVWDLVEGYISNPRTIILAIVSAKNDYANQIILKRARDKDNWQNLAPDMLGIELLRVRLSNLLFRHIKNELPKLREELDHIYDQALRGLQTLGQGRSTVRQQREFLMQLSLQFYDITKAGVNGYYESDYFGKVDTRLDFGSTLHERRLRAAVQLLNVKFAKGMCKLGHKYEFEGLVILEDDESDRNTDTSASNVNSDQDATDSELGEADSILLPVPKVLDRSKAMDWVKAVLIRTRGRELPGHFNPLLIGELFWEQSENWQALAKDHLDGVSKLCSNFVIDLLRDICPVDISPRVQASIVEESLKKRLEAGEAELKKLLQDQKRYPMTYNYYYTITIQKMRREKNRVEFERCVKDAITTSKMYNSYHSNDSVKVSQVDQEKVVRNFHEKLELDMDRLSCSDALDDLHAFYKVSLKTFIDNITIQVIERHIVHGLEEVFSPFTVTALDDAEVFDLASEPSITIRQREHLERRRSMLEKGRVVFRSILRRKA